MAEASRRATHGALQIAKARLVGIAARQEGRVSAAQMAALGIGQSTSWRWTQTDYLFRELPGVYALGHPGRTEASDLFAALLYAGPYAGLDRLTAGLWRGLVKWRTSETIHVATPRRCRSLPADHPANGLGRPISVRSERHFRRWPYHGIPTVPTPQIVLDIAATGDLQLTRYVLSQLDFMRCLNEDALRAVGGAGIPGTAVLNQALVTQQPLLARCRSPGEIDLITGFEITGVPLPQVNVKVAGITVDAWWADERVVVEVDGERNHGTSRQRTLNVEDELILREAHCLVIRYTPHVVADPWRVHGDLMPQLAERAGYSGRLQSRSR
jgi:hypothetical protein